MVVSAFVAAAKSDIKTLADLKGKRVAVQPASTVETLFRLRLKDVGLALSDVQIIRLMFQDMPATLARETSMPMSASSLPIDLGDERSGPGHRPAVPDPAGGLNLVLIGHPEFIAGDEAAAVAFLRTHRKAVEAAAQDTSIYIDAAVGRSACQRPSQRRPWATSSAMADRREVDWAT